jgi:hypothetical protein
MKKKAIIIFNVLSVLLLFVALWLIFFKADAYYIAGMQVVGLAFGLFAWAFICAVIGVVISRSRILSWIILGINALFIIAIIIFFANFTFKM